MIRYLLISLLLAVPANAQFIPSLLAASPTTGGASPLTFTSLAGGFASGFPIAGSGSYTGTAPTSISTATWGGGCSGSSTVTGFTNNSGSGVWNAAFTAPTATGLACTIAIVDNRTDTATSPAVTIAAYVGPADLAGWTTPYAFYSSFAMTATIAAAANQKAWNIRRASDSHTCDLVIGVGGYINVTANCSTGGDNGQTPAAFVAATTFVVLTAYDQSGNARDLPAGCTGSTDGSLSLLSGKFTPTFNGSAGSACFKQTGLPGAAAPVAFASVTERTARVVGINGIICGAFAVTGSFMFFDNAADNQVGIYAGGALGMVQGSVPDNAPHAMVGVIDGTSSVINVDGTETANGTNIGNQGFGITSQIGGDVASWLTGYDGECMMVTGAPTLAQRNAIVTNMRTRFGF